MANTNNNLLECVTVNADLPTCATVIWLHGLGADGYDFANIVPQLNLPNTLPIKFIFPHAPMRPITINAGYMMRAWYDIGQLSNILTQEDEAGMYASEIAVCNLIAHEIKLGTAYNKIILAGFSQGGAMALHTGLRYPKTLGGIMVLSAYLPLRNKIFVEANPANQTSPIMMAHGTEDPLIPLKFASSSHEMLTQHNYNVAWHTYSMPHAVCPEEIKDISLWLQNLLCLSHGG